MATEQQPKDLRIRYDSATTYPLPVPAITLNDGSFACDCPYCEASYLAAFSADYVELQAITQEWLDWTVGRRENWRARLCGPAYLHLHQWFRKVSTVSS